MAPKNNLQFAIRQYKPSDKAAVISLFRFGILEHVYPAFFKAMSHPDHIGIALSVSIAGYVLGGSSYFQALLFGGAWAAVVYYCCHEIHDGYLKRRLDTEMADIQTYFLDNPNNNFWVAEMEVNGRSRVAGLVAVVARKGETDDGKGNGWNDGVIDAASLIGAGGDGSAGEVFKLVVSPQRRGNGLGMHLAETAIEFCKEQGLSTIVIETSSTQTAALALFQKLGFKQTASHNNTHANPWVSKLARISVFRMEKLL
ncbi:putative N-acetyltransferase 8B [Chanos chanos]|uniref:N-acetyltransferase 8B n=1 Tax=Chanos chanos TaxID=29144 RepID=A0A6J2V4N3_CHACN|nr:putative N-acetyltransferase 8B [Chanos chanos]